jgi:hypothetical protein
MPNKHIDLPNRLTQWATYAKDNGANPSIVLRAQHLAREIHQWQAQKALNNWAEAIYACEAAHTPPKEIKGFITGFLDAKEAETFQLEQPT